MTIQLFNSNLDQLVKPKIQIFGQARSSFIICGVIGLTLAIALSLFLVTLLGLSPWLMIEIIAVAMLIFLLSVMVIKILTGHETLILYYQLIVIIGTIYLLLWFLHQPLFPYLDVVILALGLFVACGRIGCLMVGCCHGSPNSWGVSYGEEHVNAGFTPYLVGVRLFPVQAVESLLLFIIVIIGSVLVLGEHQPGDILFYFVTFYAFGRFWLEFLRGDAERNYFLAFSEAQWTSLILICVLASTQILKIFSLHRWQILVTISLLFAMATITLIRRFQKAPNHQLLNPRHIKEVAQVVNLISQSAKKDTFVYNQNSIPRTFIGCTSLGIQISKSQLPSQSGCVCHYAFSGQAINLTREGAKTLAELILKLKHPLDSNELIEGNHGVFHLLVK